MRTMIRRISSVILCAALVLCLCYPTEGKVSAAEEAKGTVYYFSSTDGNDANDGLSPETPFYSLKKAEELSLKGGDSLLLKRGDTWYGSVTLELNKGSKEEPIKISAYGDTEADKPDLRFYTGSVTEAATENVLIIRNANGVEISEISVGYGNSGIRFEYDTLNNRYVRITDCYFHDIYGVTQKNAFAEMAFSAAMYWVYAGKENYKLSDQYPVSDVYIDKCIAYDAGSLTGYTSGVKNLYMTECQATYNGYYGTVITAMGGYIDKCVFDNNGSRSMLVGSAGIMISADNFTIKNSIISNQQRQDDDPDGCGIDFEWLNKNVTVDNCLISGNAGVGVMFFTSGIGGNLGTNRGTNYGCIIKNCKFSKNNTNKGNIGGYDIYAVNGACGDCAVKNNQYVPNRLADDWILGIPISYSYTEFSNISDVATIDCEVTDNEKVSAIASDYDPRNSESTDDESGSSWNWYTDNVFSFSEDYQTETALSGLWNYYVREVVTNVYTPLAYNSETMRWEAPTEMGMAYIWRGAVHTSAAATDTQDYQTVIQFVAPYAGTVSVSFPNGITVSSGSDDGVNLSFWADAGSDQRFTNVLYTAGTTAIQTYIVEVSAGQILNFLIHRNGNNNGDTVAIDPTITYQINNIDSSKGVYSFAGDYQTETSVSGLWNYYVREIVTNSYTPLGYNDSMNRWEAPAAMGAAYIWKSGMHTSGTYSEDAAYQTCLQFVAPKSGKIIVSFPNGIWVSPESTDGISLSFWANGVSDKRFSNAQYQAGTTSIPEYEVEVAKGQKLNFLLHCIQSNEGDTVVINPTITYMDYYDVSEYRGGEVYTYPEKAGSVFAGWYKDEQFTEPIDVETTTGMAWAKFVDETVLSVKCQLSADVKTDDATTNLRMLTSVDCLDYGSVGFIVKVNGQIITTKRSTTVYRSVTALQDMEAYTVTPKKAFCDASEYFVAYSILEIPQKAFGSTFEVIPMWTTADGTHVTGAVKVFSISDNIDLDGLYVGDEGSAGYEYWE